MVMMDLFDQPFSLSFESKTTIKTKQNLKLMMYYTKWKHYRKVFTYYNVETQICENAHRVSSKRYDILFYSLFTGFYHQRDLPPGGWSKYFNVRVC